jgi:HK97 family phage portal protein
MFEKLKKMLNIREKKSLGAYSLLNGPWGVWDLGGSEVTWWKYDRFAWLAYSCNPVAYRAINIIADAVAGIPWKLYRKMADNRDVQIEQAPVLDLLKRPNPWMGEKDFFAQFIQYLQLSGNTYVRSAGPISGSNPKELYLLRPDRIEILNGDCGMGGICPDEYDGLIYEYTCGKAKERIDLRHFHHTRLWNPLCDLYGLSPLQPASSSIDQLNEALQWNVSLLKNSASPSGVLSSDGNLSDEQISRLKEQMDVKYQGVWNSGRPMLLEGGLTFSQMGMSPRDMDWIKGTQLATKNICLALGIDPSLMGDSDSKTFANYRDAERSFYINTVIPLLEKIRDDFLNRWLLPRFNMGDNVYFQYSVEAIEVLSDSRTEVFNRMIDGVKAGIITVNEAREELGYSELDTDDMDEVEEEEPPETEAQVDDEEDSPDEG